MVAANALGRFPSHVLLSNLRGALLPNPLHPSAAAVAILLLHPSPPCALSSPTLQHPKRNNWWQQGTAQSAARTTAVQQEERLVAGRKSAALQPIVVALHGVAWRIGLVEFRVFISDGMCRTAWPSSSTPLYLSFRCLISLRLALPPPIFVLLSIISPLYLCNCFLCICL